MDGESEAIPNVSYLIAASRDINGKLGIQYQFPTPTGEGEDSLVANMYANNNDDLDSTIFYLGRMGLSATLPALPDADQKEEGSKDKKKKVEDQAIEVYVYEYSPEREAQNWEMIGEGMKVATIFKNSIQIVDDSDQSEVASIKPHADLEYTELEPGFAAVLMEERLVLGFRFKSFEDEDLFLCALERMCKEVLVIQEAKREAGLMQRYTGPLLKCICLQKDGIALTLCTRYSYVEGFKSALLLGLEAYAKDPSEATLDTLHTALNSLSLPLDKRTLSLREDIEETASVKFSAFGQSCTLDFPVPRIADQLCQCQVAPLVRMFDRGVVALFNAVFTHQRVLFFSQAQPAEVICRSVVAAVLLASPLAGTFSTSVFPYTTPASRFFRTPGYVAGVSDPAVKDQRDIWDILCDLDAGTIVVDSYGNNFTDEDSAVLDAAFYSQIRFALLSASPEQEIQRQFQKYNKYLTDIAVGIPLFVNDKSRAGEIEANKWRTNLWRQGSQFEQYQQWVEQSPFGQGVEAVLQGVQSLAYSHQLSDEETIELFKTLRENVGNKEQKLEMIKLLGEYDCFNSVASGLFHSSERIRRVVHSFISCVGFIKKINPMFRLAFNRLNEEANE